MRLLKRCIPIWEVLMYFLGVRKNEPLNEMSRQQSNGIYYENIKLSNYTTIYVFGKAGNFVGEVGNLQYFAYSNSQIKALLFCTEDSKDFKKARILEARSREKTCNESF